MKLRTEAEHPDRSSEGYVLLHAFLEKPIEQAGTYLTGPNEGYLLVQEEDGTGLRVWFQGEEAYRKLAEVTTESEDRWQRLADELRRADNWRERTDILLHMAHEELVGRGDDRLRSTWAGLVDALRSEVLQRGRSG